MMRCEYTFARHDYLPPLFLVWRYDMQRVAQGGPSLTLIFVMVSTAHIHLLLCISYHRKLADAFLLKLNRVERHHPEHGPPCEGATRAHDKRRDDP